MAQCKDYLAESSSANVTDLRRADSSSSRERFLLRFGFVELIFQKAVGKSHEHEQTQKQALVRRTSTAQQRATARRTKCSNVFRHHPHCNSCASGSGAARTWLGEQGACILPEASSSR